eukprot:scaffold15498_cov129-Isochrysis_galbana.AAC.1
MNLFVRQFIHTKHFPVMQNHIDNLGFVIRVGIDIGSFHGIGPRVGQLHRQGPLAFEFWLLDVEYDPVAGQFYGVSVGKRLEADCIGSPPNRG